MKDAVVIGILTKSQIALSNNNRRVSAMRKKYMKLSVVPWSMTKLVWYKHIRVIIWHLDMKETLWHACVYKINFSSVKTVVNKERNSASAVLLPQLCEAWTSQPLTSLVRTKSDTGVCKTTVPLDVRLFLSKITHLRQFSVAFHKVSLIQTGFVAPALAYRIPLRYRLD